MGDQPQKLKRREGTQYRAGPWPFLYSVVEGRPGLVKNLQQPKRRRVKVKKANRERSYVLER